MDECFLHVDMDAFFAAVEQRDNPALRGRALVIGGGPPPWGREAKTLSLRSCEDAQSPEAAFSGRGIVTTCSYEARRYGIRSGMPIAEAWRRCPDAIYMPGSRSKYGAASDEVMELLGRFSPDLEPVSVDEAFLEVSHCRTLYGDPWQMAARIQRSMLDELGLSCSVGIGPNRLLAKMASKMKKPAGIFELPREKAREMLAGLKVEAMHGIGPSTGARLNHLGIHTLGQLADFPQKILLRWFGPAGAVALQRMARGEGGRVTRPFGHKPQEQEKSVGHSRTFGRDLSSYRVLEAELLDLVERVCRRLRAGNWLTRQVTLQLRSPDFSNRFRQAPLSRPSHREGELFEVVRQLLHENHSEDQSLRLIGVSAGRLKAIGTASEQASLFDSPAVEKENRLNPVLDHLKSDWGRDIISRLSVVSKGELRSLEAQRPASFSPR